ncbi:heavy metal translocating P-type ATPase [Actinomycetospora rhizophila]|uniref:Heavy metal translocating P-type ATPase n=1 Tax=Actinomycetospora rhizophila TaxID=1416876 RepID=A0ABV9ZIL5_9PSEU
MAISAWWRSFVRLSEARWALASLAFFVVAALTQLLDAPVGVWAPLWAACYLSGGWEPALAGLRALRERTLDVDLLMVVAAVGAAAIGQVLDGGLLIVIFATSGALEAWATERTESSVCGLLELAPERARRVGAAGEEEVDVADLRVGDEVLVRPGETISADGTVVDGAGEVDQASITGEPLPAAKTVGDEVFAGTVNGTGALRVRVAREAGASVMARIAVLVEQASATKARTQRFVETIEQRYSVGVVVATVAIFLIPLWFGEDLRGALLRAMTFMIVASPCAVVLATMPPLLAAIATAGRRGVLVKSAQVMEDLATMDAVALDKTGTLTEGRPELASVHGLGLDGDTLLALAAAAEHPSEHPLARAVVAAARARGLALADAVDFAAEPGRGVRAVVEGRSVRVGSPAPVTDPRVRRLVADAEDAGHTAVVVHVDDRPQGVLALTDALRPGARATVAALAARTVDPPLLLTGDNSRTAARVAAAVGIDDRRAELLPADKVAAIEDRRAAGRRVMVVGDGINDAPALATAHVGVAMGHAGADLTLQAADVVVVRDELATLPALVDLARRARRVVVANLVIAGSIITGLVVWDLVGTLPLPLGVAGHEGSTVLVGLNGLRLLRSGAWSPRPADTAEEPEPVGVR